MGALPHAAPPQVFRAAEAPSRAEETPHDCHENQVRSKKGLSGQPGPAPVRNGRLRRKLASAVAHGAGPGCPLKPFLLRTWFSWRAFGVSSARLGASAARKTCGGAVCGNAPIPGAWFLGKVAVTGVQDKAQISKT